VTKEEVVKKEEKTDTIARTYKVYSSIDLTD